MNRIENLKKLFVLIGYSSTGKDTILKKILEDYEGKIQPIVSTTTRPMRAKETDGVEYHFINDVDFFNKGTDFVEQRIYHTKIEENGVEKEATWRYGIERIELEKGEYLIAIVDTEGFYELRKYVGNSKIVPIYVEVPDEQLKERALQRGDLEAEIDRRLADDKVKFMPFRVKTVYDTVKNANGHFEDAVSETKTIINKHMKEVEDSKCRKKKK